MAYSFVCQLNEWHTSRFKETEEEEEKKVSHSKYKWQIQRMKEATQKRFEADESQIKIVDYS